MADLHKYTSKEVLNKVLLDSSGDAVNAFSHTTSEALNAVLDDSNNRLNVSLKGGTVDGDLTISGDLTVTGDGGGVYDEIIYGALVIDETGGTSNSAVLMLKADRGSDGQTAGEVQFYNNHSDYYAVILGKRGSADNYGDLVIKTRNSSGLGERMRIDEDGNVGIGTASPDATLHLEDGNSTKIRFSYGDGDYISQIANEWDDGVPANNKMRFHVSTGHTSNNVEALTLLGDGNVGIGVAAPTQNLHIISGTANGGGILMDMARAGDNDYHDINFKYENDTYWIAKIQAKKKSGGGGELNFFVTDSASSVPSSGMTLARGGNVGIGVTNPDQKLEVDGKIHISDEGSAPSAPDNGDGGILYTKSDGKPYWISADVADVALTNTVDVSADLDFGSYYALNEQGRQDHVANTMSSPYYRFDGIQGTVVKVGNVSSDITIYSLVVKFYLPESVTTSSSPVSLVGTDNYRGLMLGDIGGGLTNEIISFGYTSHYSYWSDASGVIAAGQHEISLVWDGSKYQIYLDGVAKTTSRVGSLSLVEPTDLAMGAQYKSNGYKSNLNGQISDVKIFNTALTAPEVKELYSGASVPFKYKGANQTAQGGDVSDDMTSNNVSNWSKTTSVLTFDTSNNWYDLDMNSGGNNAIITQAASGLTIGKRYRASGIFAKANNDNHVGVGMINTTTGDNGASVTSTTSDQTCFVDFTASTTTDTIRFKISAPTAGDEFNIKGIEVLQIGAVAEYDGSGMTGDNWYDKSGNGLDGEVTGATLENKVEALIVENRLGIGTDSPAVNLDLFASSGDAVQRIMSTSGNTAELQLLETSTDGFKMIYDGAANVMHIQSRYGDVDYPNKGISIKRDDGFVGIGETSPSALLHLKHSATGNPILTLENTAGSGTDWNIWSHNDGILYFIDGSDSILELKSDGDVSVKTGNLVIGTAGKGIDFSNAADTATGETVTSSLLDDYEEGTYTAAMTAGSGTITLHQGIDTLSYTKIGRVVHVQGQLQTSAISNPSGLLKISLPFTVASLTEASDRGSFSLRVNELTGSPGTLLGGFDEVQDALVIHEYSAGSITSAADHVDDNSEFNICVTYFTD